MIERPMMNEKLPDVTPNGMLWDVNVSPKNKILKRYNMIDYFKIKINLRHGYVILDNLGYPI
jgi:hypothetical protein